jgi:hypothetical protein
LHLAREVPWYSMRLAGQAQSRRSRLTSNVRRHKNRAWPARSTVRTMRQALGFIVAAVFIALALWHFYMASRLGPGSSGAVPSSDGKPLFVPSKPATIAVGLVLCLLAGLVAATAGAIPSALSPSALKWLSFALAFGLAVRAVGDFRYVGFFKRVRDTRFALLDTFFYSPLCLGLSACVTYIAAGSGA